MRDQPPTPNHSVMPKDRRAEPVESRSTDGHLVVHSSLEAGSDTQIAAVSGRLGSASSIQTLERALDEVFAALPASGTAIVILRGISEASDEGLHALAKGVGAGCRRGRHRLELRIEIAGFVARLFDLLALPESRDVLAWDRTDECLVARLEPQ